MPQSVEVSVVVPSRNREALLRRCIGSVLAQGGVPFELVVVDDASTDATPAMLAAMDDPRLQAIRLQERSERAAARNAGLRAASGTLVMFLDDDDHLLPGALERMAAAMRRHPDAVAAAGARVDWYGAITGHAYPHPARACVLPIWRELAAGWLLSQGQYVCRTELARDIGGWDERVATAEDVDFWLRLTRRGPVAFLVEEVVCIEREHGARAAPAADVAAVWAGMRREFAAQLPQGMAAVARRIIAADDIGAAARQAYYRGEYAACLRAHLRLFRVAPELLRSPILGPSLRASALRALAGLALRKSGLRVVKTLGRSCWPGDTRMSDFRDLRGHTIYTAGLGRSPVVVDLGANHGEFARQMRARFGATCHLVEANPVLASRLRQGGELMLWECAVAGADGQVELHVAHNDEASTVLALTGASLNGGGVRETVSVPAMTLQSLISRIGCASVDLLKIDIEGAEVAVLGTAPPETLARMGQISVEFHSDAQFGFDIREETERVIRRLRRCGFLCLDFSYGSRCDVLFINRRVHRIGTLTPMLWRLRLHGPRWLRGLWQALPAGMRSAVRGGMNRATGIDRGA